MQMIIPIGGKVAGPALEEVGGKILAKIGKTVLGKTGSYEKLASELGANRLSIPTEIWKKMSDAERWTANQKFLDRMIERGDEIILSNRVTDINDVTGYFRKELDYLISSGFKLSADGLRMTR